MGIKISTSLWIDISNVILRAIFQVIRLEENCNKLYKELKYLQIFSIILTVLMAVAVIYILRIDIQNADLENCHIHRGI